MKDESSQPILNRDWAALSSRADSVLIPIHPMIILL